MPSTRATFLVATHDRPGLVAQVAGFFFDRGLNIVESSNHTETHAAEPARFFMRVVVDLVGLIAPSAGSALGGSASRRSLEEAFGEKVRALGGTWSVAYDDLVPKVAILVTKESACLYDLVLRQRQGELKCEIPLVVSNRPDLEAVAESFRIPFYALPVTPETKPAQERQVLDLLKRHHINLVVLARYMQVVSDEFLRQAPPVINIHHGFLPAFQGAKPYHQAYARGVKLIGATAHYATKELDQGPIIEQDVARVDHRMGPEEMARVGRDVERVVLSRAVRVHLEGRVFVEGGGRTCCRGGRSRFARPFVGGIVLAPLEPMSPRERPPPPQHVMQTVESIATMHANALASVGRHQRKIEWLTGQLARPGSIYVLMALIAGWIALNLALGAGGNRALDPPPFAGLEGAVSLAALLVTTMILIAQNRLTKHTEQRAQLDLQVNLLVDAKVTKLISMLEDLRRDMPSVPNRRDSVVEEMKATVDPGQVLSALERTIEDKQSEGRRHG